MIQGFYLQSIDCKDWNCSIDAKTLEARQHCVRANLKEILVTSLENVQKVKKFLARYSSTAIQVYIMIDDQAGQYECQSDSCIRRLHCAFFLRISIKLDLFVSIYMYFYPIMKANFSIYYRIIKHEQVLWIIFLAFSQTSAKCCTQKKFPAAEANTKCQMSTDAF